MERSPRPRGQSVLTKPLLITVGLVGLVMTIGILTLIQVGKTDLGGVKVGSSIAFTSFALMMIVAAFECRSENATVFTTSTFDSKQMNWAAAAELALAVLVTQMDALRRLLDTSDLDMRQFRWSLIPPVVLLLLWEAAKLLVRRRSRVGAAEVTPTTN
jgi:Ca2+-transporting ATPase